MLQRSRSDFLRRHQRLIMTKIEPLFNKMIENNASDLHLSVGSKPRIRKHGELEELDYEVLTEEVLKEMLFEIISDDQQSKFIENNDLDFGYEIPSGRFRSNYFRQKRGISAVFRHIPAEILSLEQLKLPDQVYKFTELNQGLVLVTGPTGSGKSTTLAAIIDYINTNKNYHILTVEDPVEFTHNNKASLISQREVGAHVNSFAAALRAALREDPDVILIGEMRDLETIELAITAAETGHLVFGTLHTSSASKTIDRIIDAFPAGQQAQIRTMLSESLKGVLTQQLLRKADGSGRIAAVELLFTNMAISNLIREAKTHQIPSVIQMGKTEGMQLLDQTIMDYVMQKIISREEAYLKSNDKKIFEKFLKERTLTESYIGKTIKGSQS